MPIIGLSFDLVLETPFGLSALVYGFAAFAVGLLSTGTVQSTRWIPVAATVVVSAAAEAVYGVAASVFGVAARRELHGCSCVVPVVARVNGLLALPALGVMRWALMADERRV